MLCMGRQRLLYVAKIIRAVTDFVQYLSQLFRFYPYLGDFRHRCVTFKPKCDTAHYLLLSQECFVAAQATSSITNPVCSDPTIRKKGSLSTSSFGCPVGFFAEAQRLRRSRTPWVRFTTVHKKSNLLRSCSFGCPVGFEPTTFRTTI